MIVITTIVIVGATNDNRCRATIVIVIVGATYSNSIATIVIVGATNDNRCNNSNSNKR